MITYYLIAIFLGMFFAYLVTYIIFVKSYMYKFDQLDEKEFHDRIVKLCPRNIKRCDKCIYVAFVENPELIKPCEKEYSKYE